MFFDSVKFVLASSDFILSDNMQLRFDHSDEIRLKRVLLDRK